MGGVCDRRRRGQVTVHDVPLGMCMHSKWYARFRPLLLPTVPKQLRGANAIDATSWAMRNLYRKKYGVTCFSLYLHVKELPRLAGTPDAGRLTVGHIGTLYQGAAFSRFVAGCKQVAAESKRKLRIVRVGASPELESFAARDPDVFESHGNLSEDDALPLLASCDFHYAMYPGGSKFELFRRTSLPIKVSSYIQSQRPVFAHTPDDSTLACVIKKHSIGTVCASAEVAILADEIRKLLTAPRESRNFEAARADVMGPSQLEQLEAALTGRIWQDFPESDC